MRIYRKWVGRQPTAERIEELVKTDELLPSVEASVYLAES